MDEPQSVLQAPEEAVGGDEGFIDPRGEETIAPKLTQGLDGIGGTQGMGAPAELQLEELNDEEDLHQPPSPEFDIVSSFVLPGQLMTHPFPEVMDLRDHRLGEGALIDYLMHHSLDPSSQPLFPRNAAGPEEGLSFPCQTLLSVIGLKGGEGCHQGAEPS